MKKILVNTAFFLILIAALASCKKDYITGGQIEDVNMYKNNTNYEVLAQDPAYDTLVQLIDAAGLKDKINEPGTTFLHLPIIPSLLICSSGQYLCRKIMIKMHNLDWIH
jgi:hypothetical protein